MHRKAIYSTLALAAIAVVCITAATVHANDDAHWAFQAPVAADAPEVGDGWARNAIDNFVYARLADEGLEPSPEADRRTLIRRLSLDLLGLPPSVEEVEAFVNDERPDAYDRLVDRMLASPHYGERHGQVWLDLARYADTNGYEKDRPRTIWPYRDWVINALNNDMPYDQFVIEQLAGDLLPNATADQRIATGFLRNSMLNEEGGVDVEEFRYEAMVDRVNTVGAAVLGLTLSCGQCHDHKYDPISHEEYFQFMAYLNNTDDVTEPIITDAVTKKRNEIQAKIDDLESGLLDAYLSGPIPRDRVEGLIVSAESSEGATLTIDESGHVEASGKRPLRDTYTVAVKLPAGRIDGIELLTAVINDKGPGRTNHGNFVITNIGAAIGDAPVAFASAMATREQPNYAPAGVIDGDANTGWAMDDGAGLNQNPPILTLEFSEPIEISDEQTLTLTIDQDFGKQHTLGKFRIDGYRARAPQADETDRAFRERLLTENFEAWIERESQKTSDWDVLSPTLMQSSNRATLRRLGDNSILVSGDNPNQDTYTITFRTDAPRITAIRLEALTHESLPEGGPGRAPLFVVGDFMLSEFSAEAAPWDAPESAKPLPITGATANYAADGRDPEFTLDDRTDTGWSVNGAIGHDHRAVFTLENPIDLNGDTLLRVELAQIFIHNHTLGRFRISVTGDDNAAAANVPAEIEALINKDERSEDDHDALLSYYLRVAPELAQHHAKIASLRKSMPQYPESLTLEERVDDRPTYFYHRGEFLKRQHTVGHGTPEMLHPFPEGEPHNRLTFARWLMSRESPLTARVAVNRAWQTYFGRGFVNTPEDFGLRGSPPSHPKLFDWLAVEFMNRDWSMKELTRLIVTSATYRQSSNVTPELYDRDPFNVLLARGPRVRVNAEAVRDTKLVASGLLNPEMGGPGEKLRLPEGLLQSVYPGGSWDEAEGDARYRRGIYTYWKRVLPFPTMTTFDAPARDVSCTRRARSNTPLQALTMLNDDVTMEAARALAQRAVDEGKGSFDTTLDVIYLRCLARTPTESERASVRAFFDNQLARITAESIDTAKIAGTESTPEFAVWILVSRAILNLDETITKT